MSIISDKTGKMVNVMFKFLDGFSLVWVLMYQNSKSMFLQVTLNFELSKWILVVDIVTQILQVNEY